ncbi:hypothetical protein C8J57DRAFT_1600480 [Mycena rebaudengoi]|nr:hypothetical protein C8J57DRAFT_1600480 [Mycena rebaudengoi]
MCFLDILDNFPRLRLSSSQLKMILWMMRQCGAKDVLSFNAFREMQRRIRKTTGVRSEPHKSDLGNLFYVNDVRDLVAKDFANPEVALHIQKYPEDVDGGPISEIWQVKNGQWREIPLDELTPSILIGYKQYYIHEIAELADGRWVIPALRIVHKGKTCADCHLVNKTVGAPFAVELVRPEIVRIALDQFSFNHQDLIERQGGPIIAWNEFLKIPIDDGEDFFTVWMPVWADDVSGARSKWYQKYINVYMANANLPGQLLQQEFFVRFVSTSPHAGALEQLKVVVDQVQSTHTEPVRTYNAVTAHPCSFRLNIPDAPADNPQQAEEASHIGHQGNYFCRRCHVGGTNAERECPDGYHSFYEPGKPRNVLEIRHCVLEQLQLATLGVASHVEALQTQTGTKDKIAQHWIGILIQKSREMQAAQPSRLHIDISNELLTWLRNETTQPYNPLLDLPYFDPSQDTLVEILHTILLGDAKYTWYELHHNWAPLQQNIFTIQLQGTDLDGLCVPPIRAAYMMQYCNGLIGKHFKTLMQTMIFHIHNIVTPEQFTLVRALGELGPVLWTPVIENMEEYLADLQVLIDNLLDAFATLDPTKILIKLKLHVLLHIVQDIRRRGPAVRFSTEVFECFNAIFRLCSVLNNHQAPSLKHILSGGYWLKNGAWIRAGKDVHRILRQTPIIQKHLGWALPPAWTPGLIKSAAQKKQVVLKADETVLADALNPTGAPIDPHTQWTKASYVSTVSGDRCKVGSWTVFEPNKVTVLDPLSSCSVLINILYLGTNDWTWSKPAQGLVVIANYEVGEALHPHLRMPVLLRDESTSQSLQFVVNVQHDCRASGCDTSGVTRQMQKRQPSDTLIHSIVHKDTGRFVINTHGFHNAGLLRK